MCIFFVSVNYEFDSNLWHKLVIEVYQLWSCGVEMRRKRG